MGRPRSNRRSDKLYFIQAGKDGPIKIGVTHDLEYRLETLQTGNHVELRVVAVVPNTPGREKGLHRELKHHRDRGEWFANCDDVWSVIERETAVPIDEGKTPQPPRIVDRLYQCENCGTYHEHWEEGADPYCGACREVADMRAAGVDPLAA